jgi:hypothetical protein
MSTWRRQALAELPDLRRTIEAADSVMALWIELHMEFERAYDGSPINEERIRRIYRYALWSLRESRSDEATTAVMVAFFEHVPTHSRARSDMHRWIEPALFQDLELPFRYFLNDHQFSDLQREYRANRETWSTAGKRRRTTR